MIELHDIKIINTTLQIYLCNEMIHMHGYDCYDYGARHSQTALGRFTTPDPMAEKYYGISPYAMCNANPVRYVDPDGRDIKIGTWYGRLLAKFGVNNFEAKVQGQLSTIKSVSTELASMVGKLENSKSTYHIKPLYEHPKNIKNPGSKTTNSYSRASKTIYFDPENSRGYDGNERPPESALSHELGHAENDEDGTSVNFNIHRAASGDTDEQSKIDKNEINSITYENQVREYFGYPERPYDYFNQAVTK